MQTKLWLVWYVTDIPIHWILYRRVLKVFGHPVWVYCINIGWFSSIWILLISYFILWKIVIFRCLRNKLLTNEGPPPSFYNHSLKTDTPNGEAFSSLSWLKSNSEAVPVIICFVQCWRCLVWSYETCHQQHWVYSM